MKTSQSKPTNPSSIISAWKLHNPLTGVYVLSLRSFPSFGFWMGCPVVLRGQVKSLECLLPAGGMTVFVTFRVRFTGIARILGLEFDPVCSKIALSVRIPGFVGREV